jgi:hypothetical protein
MIVMEGCEHGTLLWKGGAVVKKTLCRKADLINCTQFLLRSETKRVFDYFSGFLGMGMVNVDVY